MFYFVTRTNYIFETVFFRNFMIHFHMSLSHLFSISILPLNNGTFPWILWATEQLLSLFLNMCSPSVLNSEKSVVCVVIFLHLHVICLWMNCICPGEFVFAAPLWLNRQTAPLIRHQLGWAYSSCLWALLPVYLKQEEEGEYNQGSSLLYIRLRGTLRLFYGGGQ